MTLKIGTLSPGLHFNVASDVYHADPCERPSLNQSLAKILLAQTPAHARLAHPRLNPDWVPRHDTKFDLGSAAHALLLGRGREFEVFDAMDWNASGGGKGAKTELHANRDAAREAGKLPILRHQYDTATEMAYAAHKFLSLDEDCRDAFTLGTGDAEVVAIAEHQGLHYRTMIDWRSKGRPVCWDYKSTQASAAPDALHWRISGEEWPIQAAMQEFILDIVEPENAGRREFRFVCQEDYEPYALSWGAVTESTMHIARRKLGTAMARWALCMSTGEWPGYPTGKLPLEYPPHVAARWMEQEAREL